jgi:hypothetical protein
MDILSHLLLGAALVDISILLSRLLLSIPPVAFSQLAPSIIPPECGKCEQTARQQLA